MKFLMIDTTANLLFLLETLSMHTFLRNFLTEIQVEIRSET